MSPRSWTPRPSLAIRTSSTVSACSRWREQSTPKCEYADPCKGHGRLIIPTKACVGSVLGCSRIALIKLRGGTRRRWAHDDQPARAMVSSGTSAPDGLCSFRLSPVDMTGQRLPRRPFVHTSGDHGSGFASGGPRPEGWVRRDNSPLTAATRRPSGHTPARTPPHSL